MSAFDQAWDLVKMPMYHGTSEDAWEKIQQEGLKPSDTLGYEEWIGDDVDETEYAFAHGDRGYPHPHVLGPGGVPSAIFNSLTYANDEWFGPSKTGKATYDGKGVVLEISDDAPGWIEQPSVGMSGGESYRHQGGKDIRLSPETTPPEFIRRVSPEEIDDALRAYYQYRQAEEDRRRLMLDLEWSGGLRGEDKEEFERIMYGDRGVGGYGTYKDDYHDNIAIPYWPVSYEQKVKWSQYPDMVRRE